MPALPSPAGEEFDGSGDNGEDHSSAHERARSDSGTPLGREPESDKSCGRGPPSQHALARHLLVQGMGTQVDSTRPGEGSGLIVDRRPLELRPVFPTFENAFADQIGEVHDTLCSVVELDPDPVTILNIVFDHSAHLSSPSFQRLDLIQRLVASSTLPVSCELVLVLARPLGNQPQPPTANPPSIRVVRERPAR